MLDEYYVDGYMNTLLSLFQFDDYPCLFYPQHIFTATLTSEKGEELIIERYPRADPNQFDLTALNFYKRDDRLRILEHLSYIHQQIATGN